MLHLVPVLGLFVMLGIAWALSANRAAIKWRPVAMGTALQIVFALIILKTEVGRNVFDVVGAGITRFLDFTDAGASFVFGERFKEFYFAFKVLPTIIFFSSFITVLYYFGILQWIVSVFAKVMMRTMGTSGAESLSASANIFVGQTEAPLLIRPYVAEDDAVGADGGDDRRLRDIAGGVMAAYVGMRQSRPSTCWRRASCRRRPRLVMAKLMFPETGQSR